MAFVPQEVREAHDQWGNAPDLLTQEDAAVLEAGTWYRAGGECLCDACGREYWRHPYVIGALWLHRICDGDLVHL